MDIIGTVTKVHPSRRGKTLVTVRGSRSEREVKCEVSVPLEVGDLVSCAADNHGDKYVAVSTPVVYMGTTKEALTQALVLSGWDVSAIDAFLQHHREKSNDLLDHYAEDFHYTQVIPEAEDEAETKAKVPPLRVLVWWYTHRVYRKLLVMGLSRTDIRESKMHTLALIKACQTNPYSVANLSVTSCESLCARYCITVAKEDIQCGKIIRRLYQCMQERSWTCVDKNSLADILKEGDDALLPRLIKTYPIVWTFQSLYWLPAYQAEERVAHRLIKLLEYNMPPVMIPNLDSLSLDQQKALRGAMINPVTIIQGAAGTGKTTLLKTVCPIKTDCLLTSFTGKAVARMREVTHQPAATMHLLLVQPKRAGRFSYLIIDEASMVTTELLSDFFELFPGPYGILFIGDIHQLMPTSWGRLLEQLLKTNRIPTFELTTNHRLANKQDAIAFYSDRLAKDLPTKFVTKGNVRVVQGGIEEVMKHDGIVLCPYREPLLVLNKRLSKRYNSHGDQSYKDSKGNEWVIGDCVMLTENAYDIDCFNGTEGLIVGIKDGVVVRFTSGVETYFPEDAGEEGRPCLNMLTRSFAITCHRSQGSEWDHVIIYVPKHNANARFLSRPIIYTSLTRARKSVTIVGDIKEFDLAANRPGALGRDNLWKLF